MHVGHQLARCGRRPSVVESMGPGPYNNGLALALDNRERHGLKSRQLPRAIPRERARVLDSKGEARRILHARDNWRESRGLSGSEGWRPFGPFAFLGYAPATASQGESRGSRITHLIAHLGCAVLRASPVKCPWTPLEPARDLLECCSKKGRISGCNHASRPNLPRKRAGERAVREGLARVFSRRHAPWAGRAPITWGTQSTTGPWSGPAPRIPRACVTNAEPTRARRYGARVTNAAGPKRWR
jgi:hypothetical protein